MGVGLSGAAASGRAAPLRAGRSVCDSIESRQPGSHAAPFQFGTITATEPMRGPVDSVPVTAPTPSASHATLR